MVKAVSSFNTRLVDAIVDHERLRKGEPHSFRYRVFYALLDIDELSLLDQSLWTFSSRGRSIYSLGSKDFIQYGQTDIRGNIEYFLRNNGINGPIGSIQVFAHLRTFGFNFNPLSVFFIETEAGTLCLAEVDNTFGEAKLFFLGPLGENGRISKRLAKDYYVSPFIELDTDFIFDIVRQDDHLKVQVTTMKGKEAILFARMQGRLQPISDRRLLGYFLRMPLTPLRVLAAIHWQALRLMSKRIRFYRKQEFAEKQKDYYERKDHSRHVT